MSVRFTYIPGSKTPMRTHLCDLALHALANVSRDLDVVRFAVPQSVSYSHLPDHDAEPSADAIPYGLVWRREIFLSQSPVRWVAVRRIEYGGDQFFWDQSRDDFYIRTEGGEMTDQQIIDALKSGETLNYGCNGRNSEVMDLMADLESKGLIETWGASLSQETRRSAKWIAKLEGGE